MSQPSANAAGLVEMTRNSDLGDAQIEVAPESVAALEAAGWTATYGPPPATKRKRTRAPRKPRGATKQTPASATDTPTHPSEETTES